MIEYQNPYNGLVWDNIIANTDSNQQALNQVNWKFLFSNKSVYQQVEILNNTLINVFSNLFSNKIILH